MAKHALKILRREHRKIFKVCLAKIMHEKVKKFLEISILRFCKYSMNSWIPLSTALFFLEFSTLDREEELFYLQIRNFYLFNSLFKLDYM